MIAIRTAKQTDIFPCGNGDGFVKLTDRAGKVFGKATYLPQIVAVPGWIFYYYLMESHAPLLW